MHMILNFSFLFIFVTLTVGIAHLQTALQQISSWMSANLHSIWYSAKTACVAHKNFITDTQIEIFLGNVQAKVLKTSPNLPKL